MFVGLVSDLDGFSLTVSWVFISQLSSPWIQLENLDKKSRRRKTLDMLYTLKFLLALVFKIHLSNMYMTKNVRGFLYGWMSNNTSFCLLDCLSLLCRRDFGTKMWRHKWLWTMVMIHNFLQSHFLFFFSICLLDVHVYQLHCVQEYNHVYHETLSLLSYIIQVYYTSNF